MNASNNLNHSSKKVFFDLFMKKLLIIIILIVFSLLAVNSTLVVQEDELVVIKQFGSILRIMDAPGLYFKLPLIQNTVYLTKKIEIYEAAPVKVFSSDKKSIIAYSYTIWKIIDPHSFLATAQTIGNAEALIESAVSTAVREKCSKLSYEEIIRGFSSDKNYNEEVEQKLQGAGIDILDVRILRTELPSDEEEAAYTRIKLQREKIAKQYISDAENDASQIKAEADKQAKIIISSAFAASEEMKGKADAEAAKIYAASYNRDPEFYKFIRTLESYKKTLRNKPTIVLPIDSPYAKYLIGK